MRIRLHMLDRLTETVGGVCAGVIILAMLAFAIAETMRPIVAFLAR